MRVPREIDEQSLVVMGQFLARYGAVEFARAEDSWGFLADRRLHLRERQGHLQSRHRQHQAGEPRQRQNCEKTQRRHSADFRALRTKVNKAALSGRRSAYYMDGAWEVQLPAFNTETDTPYIRNPDGSATLDGYPVVWTDVLEPYGTSAAAAKYLAAGLDVAPEPPGPWSGVVRESIDKRVEATLEYRAVADAAAEKRVVEPRLLFQRDGQWYLAAWNVAKQAEHLFRLDRIVTVELGTRVFGEHKGPPVARYAKRNLYFESGAERDVMLRFRGNAARLARERYGTRARANADGTVSVTLKVTPGNYLLGVVLGYGGEATIEGPPDVVAQLRERVEELQRIYA